MTKTRKSIQRKRLETYDVFIEDTSSSSTYFQVTNLPPIFTGGRNSFLLAGSPLLAPGSSILVEILDASGATIFQNPVRQYVEGKSRMITVEVNENTAPGFATIVILGRTVVSADGTPIPPDWQNSYNVRWTRRILVEPNRRNISQLVLESTPTIFSEEQRLYSVDTASYTTNTTTFTASLSPILYSAFQIGYLIQAESPTRFTADYIGSYITGSLIIDGDSSTLYLPITEILNDTTAFSTGQLIQTSDGKTINNLLLYSGSYTASLFGSVANVTSSAILVYDKLNVNNLNIPVSYAKLRVTNLNTVSGEIYKFKIYSKVATNLSEYKLVADVPVKTSELLVSGSLRGELPIGNFVELPSASTNWYADRLETGSNVLYPISGSSAYYDSANTIVPLTLSVTDDVLLRSLRAQVPIYNNTGYDGQFSSSGYFIGNKRPLRVFPTSEYTIQLDAVHKNFSGSANLGNNGSRVDIYLIGTNDSVIVDNDPLGQKIGTLTVSDGAPMQRYESKRFNFVPQLATDGLVSIRFVITNGFWYFSNISLKPSSDEIFSPDETTVIIPNTEYYNEYLRHKIEFFDINNNSTDISIESVPTFFTGSNIDLGVL